MMASGKELIGDIEGIEIKAEDYIGERLMTIGAPLSSVYKTRSTPRNAIGHDNRCLSPEQINYFPSIDLQIRFDAISKMVRHS